MVTDTGTSTKVMTVSRQEARNMKARTRAAWVRLRMSTFRFRQNWSAMVVVSAAKRLVISPAGHVLRVSDVGAACWSMCGCGDVACGRCACGDCRAFMCGKAEPGALAWQVTGLWAWLVMKSSSVLMHGKLDCTAAQIMTLRPDQLCSDCARLGARLQNTGVDILEFLHCEAAKHCHGRDRSSFDLAEPGTQGAAPVLLTS